MVSSLNGFARKLRYSNATAALIYWPALAIGALWFRLTGRTPLISYVSMRRLYCVTRGKSNALLRRWLSTQAPPVLARDDRGLMDRASAGHDVLLKNLRRDGFSVLGQLLDSSSCKELIEWALNVEARPTPALSPVRDVKFDAAQPLAVRYDLPEPQVVAHPVVRRLLADPSLISLARDYLACEPVNDLVAMWWSAPGPVSSEAAQLYHFDMDRPQFLKIFFYLTDVDESTGPHCYMRASHRDRTEALWRDGRFTDEEIFAGCGQHNEVRIVGPAGTAIAVDTSGLHKGAPLVRGHRLMLQLEFTSALFGQEYLAMSVPPDEVWKREIATRPHYYRRFSLQAAR